MKRKKAVRAEGRSYKKIAAAFRAIREEARGHLKFKELIEEGRRH
jgi:hypothetical protein